MASVIHYVNQALTGLFGILFWPFRGLGPVWPLAFVSLLTGIAMVWIFGKVSNQEAIRGIRQKIMGNLLGVRLYQHDVSIVLGLQARILRDTLTYMRNSMVPMLVLLVPVLLILVQLNLFFSVRPLRPGEQAIVKARLKGPPSLNGRAALHSEPGVRVETPPVRIPSLGEVAWRIRAGQPGQYRLAVQVGEETVSKELVVGDRWDAVSTLRTKDWLDQLLYSGEAPIEAEKSVSSVEVLYRPLPISIGGWDMNWLVLFFVLSIAFGYAFKGVLGVEL